MLEDIKTQLSKHIDKTIVDEILEHYRALKVAYQLQDWEKCLIRGGKFSEVIMKAIHFLRTGEVTRRISVESEINEALKQSGLPDSIRLLIPRAIRVLYDHRSQRGGAHTYPFSPNAMDSILVSSTADWILGELVRLYYTTDPDSALTIVKALTGKTVPFVEYIDGDYVVLRKNAPAREQIGFILYSTYPSRTTSTQLKGWIIDHPPRSITTSLQWMEKAKLIHRNSEGVILTTLGIRDVEQEIQPRLEVSKTT